MAEREGFEPSNRLPRYTLSKRAPSATRTPLQPDQKFSRLEEPWQSPSLTPPTFCLPFTQCIVAAADKKLSLCTEDRCKPLLALLQLLAQTMPARFFGWLAQSEVHLGLLERGLKELHETWPLPLVAGLRAP